MGGISRKSIAELAPAAKNLGHGHNLKGTIKVFLRTKKFRELNEGILRRPVSELYPEWKSALYSFLELRNRSHNRNRLRFFRDLSESFFRAYAVQSATEFWAPSTIAMDIARMYSDAARRRYLWMCRRDGIDQPDLSQLPSPLRMRYVPLDWGLGNLVHSQNKKAEHLKLHFRPIFESLLSAAKKGRGEFNKTMRDIETGDTDVQLNLLCSSKELFYNTIRWDTAYKATTAAITDSELKETFSECVRLNEEFTIMNDLHGGFAMFNADVAGKVIKDVLRHTDEKGRKEVESAGWCWRQIGALYLLLEQNRLGRAV